MNGGVQVALTVDVHHREMFGRFFTGLADVTFDNNYLAGGMELEPDDFGFKGFDFVSFSSNGGYYAEFDYAANKIIMRSTTIATEVAPATDLSLVTIKVLAFGH